MDFLYPQISVTATNPSVGTNGSSAPTSSTEIGFIDGSGNLQGASASNPLPVTVTNDPNPQNVNLSQVGGAAITEGQKTMAASLPVVIASDQSALPISASALPLPAGAATSALQTTGNSVLGSILLDLTNGTQITQITGTVPLPTGAATSALQSTMIANQTNGTQVTQITGTVTSTDAANGPVTPGIVATKSELIGGQFNTSLPTLSNTQQAAVQLDSSGRQLVVDSAQSSVNGSKAPGTAAAQSGLVGGIYTAAGITLTDGQQAALQTSSKGDLLIMADDMFITGATAQTVANNNILLTTTNSTPTDVSGYKSASVQVTSTGTGGTFIFEASNDNSNWVTLPVVNSTLVAGVVIVAAITATSSAFVYTFPLQSRYIRCRIATTITGGSLQAFTRLSQATWSPSVAVVTQATGANLAVSGTVTVTGVSTTANQSTVYTNADQASAAIVTTTTSAVKTLSLGTTLSLEIDITAASGTNPTYDLAIQVSDGATNFITIYQTPRLTGTGFFITPPLMLGNISYRYVETIGGSTPSFTRSITSNRSFTPGVLYRNLVDRTIAPTTTNSATASLFVEGFSTVGMIVNQGTGGSSVIFALDGSDDNVNWENGIAIVAGIVGGTSPVSTSFGNGVFRYIRARVVTGVASTTVSYVTLWANPIGLAGGYGKASATPPFFNDYTSTSITTSAFTQLVASTNAQINLLDIFDSSGKSMILAVGASGSEVVEAYIAPGGEQIPIFIPAGSRISYKALSVNATTGYLTMNFLT